MDELLYRIRNIHIALTSNLSKIEIIVLFLSELAAMDFNKINKQERNIIEHAVRNIQNILDKYKTSSNSGYQNIPEDQLMTIIGAIESLCAQLFLRISIAHPLC